MKQKMAKYLTELLLDISNIIFAYFLQISILRAQLKQAQKSVDNEKLQKLQQIDNNQQEWNEKYNRITKEKQSAQNELELKVSYIF